MTNVSLNNSNYWHDSYADCPPKSILSCRTKPLHCHLKRWYLPELLLTLRWWNCERSRWFRRSPSPMSIREWKRNPNFPNICRFCRRAHSTEASNQRQNVLATVPSEGEKKWKVKFLIEIIQFALYVFGAAYRIKATSIRRPLQFQRSGVSEGLWWWWKGKALR